MKKKKEKLIVFEKQDNKTCVERYFFKYAFPCSQVKVKLGSLSEERYNELMEIFLKKSSPNKEVLEKTFPPAFRRINKLAKKINKNTWDFSVIKKYWEEEHNIIIDQGDGMYGTASESFKDLCKVHEAEVIKKHENKLIVEYNAKKRIVSDFLVPEVQVGDKVRIHFAFVIEKVL
tara:strand:+ start:483 stop:1007 length:525 start_codon:yes stop_codon:yes gene_type:complete